MTNQDRKKKLKWQLPFLALLIIGTIYIIKNHHETPYQKNEGMIFGTIYHLTYQCDSSLQNEIVSELQKVDHSLSPFNKESIITRASISLTYSRLPTGMVGSMLPLSTAISL